MPTLTASRKCYSKQIMLNSVSLSLGPSGWSRASTQAQPSHRCSFFSVHHWYFLSLTSSQCCLELPTSVGSLLDRWTGTCCALPPLHLPMYGMVQRKRVKTQQASHEKGGISLMELLWFSAKAVAFVPPPIFICICFCSSIFHTDKGEILNFLKCSVFIYEIAYMFLWSGSYFVYS